MTKTLPHFIARSTAQCHFSNMMEPAYILQLERNVQNECAHKLAPYISCEIDTLNGTITARASLYDDIFWKKDLA